MSGFLPFLFKHSIITLKDSEFIRFWGFCIPKQSQIGVRGSFPRGTFIYIPLGNYFVMFVHIKPKRIFKNICFIQVLRDV